MKYLLTSLVCGSMMIIGGHLSSSQAWAEENAIPQPRIITVASGSVGGIVRLGGSVVPEQIVNLTAQMPGDVSFVAGSEGDAFEQGDALIALDTTTLLAKREQAMSQLASAEAAHRNAVVQYNHELRNPNAQANSMLGGAPGMFSIFSDPARSMMGQGSPGIERGSNLYAQGIQVETARNSVAQARAALRELDESLQNAISYAPFAGVIVKKMVEQGDIVQPGMPLVSFADVTRLQVRVDVPTRLLKVIKAGGQIQAQLDGDSSPVPVVVERIFPMADPGGHTTTAEFNLPPGTDAHSGMYAEIMLPDPSSRVSALPVIPESAIVWRGSLPAVFQVADDGHVRLRLIRIDDYASNGIVSVISGISAGDKILAEPSSNTRSVR